MDKNGHGIIILYIESENQIADILTKGLGDKLFYPLQDFLMGWTKGSDEQNDDALEGELKDAESAEGNGCTTGDAKDLCGTRVG